MEKFTPGPWKVTHNSWDISTINDRDTGKVIAQCRIDEEVTEETQDIFEQIKDANANLIHKAPEMYNELQNVRDVLTCLINGGYDGYVSQRNRVDRILSEARSGL